MRTPTHWIAGGAAALALAGLTTGGLTGALIGRTTAPVPDECIVALDQADQTIDLAAEALLIAGDGIVYAAEWDVAGIESATADLDEIDQQMSGLDYEDARDACLDGRKDTP